MIAPAGEDPAVADLRALADANDDFYAAFEARDPDRMAARWQRDGAARLVQPGGDLVVGWPAVERALAALLLNSGELSVFLTDVEVLVDGDLGVVSCAENVLSGADLDPGRVLATNVFRRVDGHWRLTLRHGSPVL